MVDSSKLVSNDLKPDTYPLSLYQEQILFFYELNRGSWAYNIPAAIRIDSSIDCSALEKAIDILIERHSSLRTAFYLSEKGWRQIINKKMNFSLPLKQVVGGSKEEIEAEAQSILKLEAQRPFDLERGPLFRPILYKLGDESYILQLTTHHIISDGWSMKIVHKEIMSIYECVINNSFDNLPSINAQYVDFCKEQIDSITAGRFDAQIEYWKDQLQNAPTKTLLPADHKRSVVQTLNGDVVKNSISTKVTNWLKDVAKSEHTSLFVVVLAACHSLIYRYTGQLDSTIGFLHGNRTTDTNNVVGLFANMLPMRLDFSKSHEFREIVKKTHEAYISACKNGAVSINKIVDVLGIERDISYNPLFQITVVYDTIRKENDAFRTEYYLVDEEKAKFDLTLYVSHENGQLSITAEYNNDVYCKETIGGFLNGLEELMSCVSLESNKGINIDDASIINMSDKEMMTIEWNSTNKHIDDKLTLIGLLESKASLNPDKVAICQDFDGEEVTYSELSHKVNILVSELLGRGLKKGDRIGVYMTRSIDMVVSMMAILKIGATFIPIDPDQPVQRAQFIISNSHMAGLLVKRGTIDQFDELPSVVYYIDTGSSTENLVAHNNIEIDNPHLYPAYIIYTSGSTGRPKGAVNNQLAICNRLIWMQSYLNSSANDRVLHKTPIDFDVSVWEIFLPLMSGGTLILAKHGGHREPSYLKDVIDRQGITILHFVPSMYRIFLAEPSASECDNSLKHVICSGEELTIECSRKHFKTLPNTSLHNLYGPTEAAIDVTAWECNSNHDMDYVPIGRPIDNLEIYILDEKLNPVPIGGVGEIYIGGIGVGDGYYGNATLTKERFIDCNVKGDKESRLYKTGDLASFLPSGAIRYHGRNDNQVKVHGQRIELGEIESCIRENSAIIDCVVRKDLDNNNVPYIVAYLETKPEYTETGCADLRGWLSMKLPSSMVPSKFVIVPAFPRLTNGKIDHKNLARLKGEAISDNPVAIKGEEARGRLQTTLVDIFSKVLDRDSIFLDDRFFNIGGDSIRAIQVVQLCRENSINISIADLFSLQTVRDIARFVDSSSDQNLKELSELSDDSDSELLSQFLLDSNLKNVDDIYPLSTLQEGLIYHSINSAEYRPYTTSYKVCAEFDESFMRTALSEMACQHEMLRTSFHLTGFTIPVQVVHERVDIPLIVKDIRHIPTEEKDSYIQGFLKDNIYKLFDWETAPLFEFYVHIVEERLFQFTIIEPCLDGWSVSQLATGVLSHYRRLLSGHNRTGQKPLSTKFRDYVLLERRYSELPSIKNYWKQYLDSAPATILKDIYKDNYGSPHHVRKEIKLSSCMSYQLRSIAESIGVPLKTVLLATHLVSISMLTGQKEVVTGLTTNGRPEKEDSSSVIGLFLNVLPIRMDFGEVSWRKIISKVYESESKALSNRHYPYAKIKKDHGDALFDSIFNYVHFYPYGDFDDGPVKILDISANDQTFFFLTAQYTVDWMNKDIVIKIDMNTSELEHDLIEKVVGYYDRVVADVCKNYDGRVNKLSLLPEDDRVTLLEDWSIGDIYPCHEQNNFLDLFHYSVERFPLKVCVADKTKKLTYRELDCESNSIANAICSISGGNPAVVAYFGYRDVNVLISLIGIFKSGCAYLPLDLNWPAQRIAEILSDSGCDFIVACRELSDSVNAVLDVINSSGKQNISIVYIEEALDETNLEKKDYFLKRAQNNLAYVIYTSGSTGKPKGAMVEHCGMLNHLLAKKDDVLLNCDSIIAQTAPITFDISIWQLLSALVVGGRTEIIDTEITVDPMGLGEYIVSRDVNVYETVPTILRTISRELEMGSTPLFLFSKLKCLMVTGENFPADLYRTWHDFYPNTMIINAYGPTECSDDVTHFVGTSQLPNDYISVPIGKPIRNTELYVVDEKFDPVPIGIPGELIVGGVGVGLGYINDVHRTNKAFSAAPIADKPPLTMYYRTGDLVRYLPDGNLEFLQRIDHQVKINGVRIELEEIESTLRLHPETDDVVVVKSKLKSKDCLVAYIKFVNLVELDSERISEIKLFLRQRLPEQLIPRFFKLLSQEVPTNSNGKVDRSKLADVCLDTELNSLANLMPESLIEQRLLDTWASVLDQNIHGVASSFFDIGGDSLLAIRLVSILNRDYGTDLSVKDLLMHPSIRDLGRYMSTRNISVPLKDTDKDNGSVEDRFPSQNTTIYKQPLDKLISIGRLDKVDSISLGYIPDSVVLESGLNREIILEEEFEGLPKVRSIYSTPSGRVAHIMLPIFASDLYTSGDLTTYIIEALRLGKSLGAKVASLTGLLPSATEYGIQVKHAIPDGEELPLVTTGHETTAAAVVMAIEYMLGTTNRAMAKEVVGVLGVGSIGLSVTELFLTSLEHPMELVLCDVYSNLDELVRIKEEIILTHGYKGKITLLASRTAVPDSFYSCSLIIGATNVGGILDVNRLNAGTMIVDDSAPHCFNVKDAILRFEADNDIIFSEAGILRHEEIINEDRYIPLSERGDSVFKFTYRFRESSHEIMGCILSGVLCANSYKDVITLGSVKLADSVAQYKKLNQDGYTASKLSCQKYLLSDDYVKKFSQRSWGERKLNQEPEGPA